MKIIVFLLPLLLAIGLGLGHEAVCNFHMTHDKVYLVGRKTRARELKITLDCAGSNLAGANLVFGNCEDESTIALYINTATHAPTPHTVVRLSCVKKIPFTQFIVTQPHDVIYDISQYGQRNDPYSTSLKRALDGDEGEYTTVIPSTYLTGSGDSTKDKKTGFRMKTGDGVTVTIRGGKSMYGGLRFEPKKATRTHTTVALIDSNGAIAFHGDDWYLNNDVGEITTSIHLKGKKPKHCEAAMVLAVNDTLDGKIVSSKKNRSRISTRFTGSDFTQSGKSTYNNPYHIPPLPAPPYTSYAKPPPSYEALFGGSQPHRPRTNILPLLSLKS